MQCTVLQENLHHALNDVIRCISSRPQLPILGSILVVAQGKEVTLFATDLQFGMRTSIAAEVAKEGTTAIPAKVFADFIATLSPGKVEITLDDHTVSIKAVDAKAKLQTFAADDYPLFPTVEGESLSLPLDVLAPAVQATSFASSLDETRPVLTSLFMQFGEELEIVGTDGFRLSRIILPYSAQPQSFLIPAKALSEVVRIAVRKKVEEVSLTVSDKLKQVFLSFDGYSISMRLLEGQYPPYQKILPNELTTQVLFDTEEFQQKLKTASIFARESSGIITLTVKESEVVISSASSTYGNQESSVKAKHITPFTGEQEIAFNSKYIQDFLTTVKPKTVLFGMNESLKPAVLRPQGMDALTYVVMPFRVQK